MVVPVEIAHAQYAREVLRFLLRKFRKIRAIFFHRKLFPELSEGTGLLLCEEFERPCEWFSAGVYSDLESMEKNGQVEQRVDAEALRSGRVRLTRYLLSPRARDLYDGLAEREEVVRLGVAADVGIGYVTGHNDYFHLSTVESRHLRIPARFLRPAVLSLTDYDGVIIRKDDWRHLASQGRKVYLLSVPAVSEQSLPRNVLEYLKRGEQLRVPERYKCSVRDPWYSVPHVRTADAFLSYMSGNGPRLVRNAARLVSPNTLHLVRFNPGRRVAAFIAGWRSSLTRLSCELEGHPLGGGMLKLEPTEAERVLISLPSDRESPNLVRELDKLVRLRDYDAATRLADRQVLRRRLGLTERECLALRDAAAEMYRWRMHK